MELPQQMTMHLTLTQITFQPYVLQSKTLFGNI